VVREVERRVEVRTPPPPKGRINGMVVEQGPSTPIAGAVVRFPGTELSPLVTGDDGRFVSYEFDPGDVPMEITHDEYEPGSCVATIAEAGGDVEVRCELVAKPRLGIVAGRVVGDAGAAVSAAVVIAGPMSRTVQSDAAGAFTARDLTPGSYTARVEADGYLIKLQTFEIQPRETTNIQIDLIARPRRALVNLRRRDIQIRRQINFATDSAEILADSYPLMTEIADVIIRNPDLTRIEIQGHTDNRGTAEHNLDLSQRRADSVRQWLIDNGVESSRLEAKGYGMSTPLVPNITPANRARNRRVQFIIVERAEAAPAAAPAE
jgi:outer membrane protein OmpA-like peptidoglycan-associated protein